VYHFKHNILLSSFKVSSRFNILKALNLSVEMTQCNLPQELQ
jgi:hypothetical protein